MSFFSPNFYFHSNARIFSVAQNIIGCFPLRDSLNFVHLLRSRPSKAEYLEFVSQSPECKLHSGGEMRIVRLATPITGEAWFRKVTVLLQGATETLSV